MIERINDELEPIERQLFHYARQQPGCRALMPHYGIGAVTAVAILSEHRDARRFSSSRKAIRHSGLDVTVYGRRPKADQCLRTSSRCQRRRVAGEKSKRPGGHLRPSAARIIRRPATGPAA